MHDVTQVDSFTTYAASAVAAVSSFRSLAGFGFPLFANPMFHALGLGWGNTLLAGVALVVGFPAPFLFYKYGERIRGMSPAVKGLERVAEKEAPSKA